MAASTASGGKRRLSVMAASTASGGKPLGISLHGMQALVEAHGGRCALAGLSTGAIKSLVLAATADTRTSYAAQLLATGSLHVAPATAFISHAYNDEFLGVLDAVAVLEARERTSAFYYFDLLVVNQHDQSAVVPFEVLRDVFGPSVKAIGRTLLVLRWANPIALERAWCVYELATTLNVGASVKVLMPPEDAAAFKDALLNDFKSLTYKTCRVDVEKAGAREKADLDNIQRVIKETGGYLKTNQLVIESMKSWMVEEGRAALASAAGDNEKASLMDRLATLLHGKGRYDEAEPLYLESLAARRRMLGNEHPDTLQSMHSLAVLLSDQGKNDKAEPLFLEALAARRRTLGNEHPDTLFSLNSMACLLRDKNEYDEAEPLYLESLAARRRTLGNEHPGTLHSINNMAVMLSDRGRYIEAEKLYFEALTARRRTLGNEHPDTLNSINNMAIMLSDQGKYIEAESLYLEALAASRRTLGNEHPDTLNLLNSMGTLLYLQGKYSEAEPLFLENLAASRRTLGGEHPDTLSSLSSMAGLLRDQGKYDEAEPLYLEVLVARRRTLGNEHLDTLNSINNIACLLRDHGKYDEAEPLFLEALAARKRKLRNEHPDTLDSIKDYARLKSERGGTGDLSSSEALYKEGLPICRRLLGDTNVLTVQFISGLAACLRRQGRFHEALPLAKEAYDSCYAKLGGSHLASLFSAHELGAALRLLKRPEEALPYALAAFEGRLRLQGSKSRLTLASQLSVAHLQGDHSLASSIRGLGIAE